MACGSSASRRRDCVLFRVCLVLLFLLLLMFRAVLLLPLVQLHTKSKHPLHRATHSKGRSQKQAQQEQLMHLFLGHVAAAPAGPAGAGGCCGLLQLLDLLLSVLGCPPNSAQRRWCCSPRGCSDRELVVLHGAVGSTQLILGIISTPPQGSEIRHSAELGRQ